MLSVLYRILILYRVNLNFERYNLYKVFRRMCFVYLLVLKMLVIINNINNIFYWKNYLRMLIKVE